MRTSPEFFCYQPRPKHVDLEPFEAAIFEVMGNAKGIFAKGMSKEFIRARLLESHAGVLGSAPSIAEIGLVLRKMRGLEIVEQRADDPDVWRIKP